MNNESVHQRLKRVREQKGLTAKAVAKLVGVPQSTYLDWENGRGLKLPPLQKLCQVLAISVTELLINEKPPLAIVTSELEEVELKLREVRSLLSSFL
jgi:transcriptional regulator with XRE-family HTH domain